MSETTTVQAEEQVMGAPTEHVEPPITGHDRCDRCAAQAFVRTRHPFFDADKQRQATDLHWCAHHYQGNEEKLVELVVLDDRAKLHTKLEAAAY